MKSNLRKNDYILGGSANVMFYFCSHTKEPVRGEGSFTNNTWCTVYDVLDTNCGLKIS